MAKITFDVNLGDLETALCDRALSKEEIQKENNSLLGGEKLRQELLDASKPDIDKDVHINLKSHGIYIQFDRTLVKQGIKKWSFMVRASVWGGGDINWQDWNKYSALAEKYSTFDDGFSSIRLTTRQTFQYHRISKINLLPMVHGLINIGRLSLNGCGDNTRNPTASPIVSDLFDANNLAKVIGKYFQLPEGEHKNIFSYEHNDKCSKSNAFNYDRKGLPRKFKIGIGGIYTDHQTKDIKRCNAADILTNDIGIAPLLSHDKLSGYQIYIGGGLGQKNRKVTFATTAVPLGIVNSESELIRGLDAIVYLQQQIGDRKNRNWARLKNVLIKKGLEILDQDIEEIILDRSKLKIVQQKGVEWFLDQLIVLGFTISPPTEIDLGEMNRHHGWIIQPDGKLSFGLWIQNGRITNSNPQGKIKLLIDDIINNIKPNIRITPHQDLLFTDIDQGKKNTLTLILEKHNYSLPSELRRKSISCVGLSTCPLAVAESEKYFDPLIKKLEEINYLNYSRLSIGISGCERHCSRNIRHPISIEGKADKTYQLKLTFGKDTSDLLADDLILNYKKYLRKIPQVMVIPLLKHLILRYNQYHKNEESISEYHERIGLEGIFNSIEQNVQINQLLENTSDAYTV